MFTTRNLTSRITALATVTLLALSACSSVEKVKGVSTTSLVVAETTTTVAETTTVAPVATDAPTTTAAPSPPTEPPAPVYSPLGESRLVMLPEDDNVFNVGEFTCAGGIDFPYGVVEQCVEGVDVLVISYRIPDAERAVEVYVRVDTFWVEAYRTSEEYESELTAVDLYLGDYAGLGYPAVFIGYRIVGTASLLDFDIVQSREGGGVDVRGIRSIDHGNVRLPGDEPGAVVSAVYADGEPICCPSNLLFQDLAYVDGAWSVGPRTLYAAAAAPEWGLVF